MKWEPLRFIFFLTKLFEASWKCVQNFSKTVYKNIWVFKTRGTSYLKQYTVISWLRAEQSNYCPKVVEKIWETVARGRGQQFPRSSPLSRNNGTASYFLSKHGPEVQTTVRYYQESNSPEVENLVTKLWIIRKITRPISLYFRRILHKKSQYSEGNLKTITFTVVQITVRVHKNIKAIYILVIIMFKKTIFQYKI